MSDRDDAAAGPTTGEAAVGRVEPVVPEEPAVLPDRSPDDTDEGWGERGSGEERDDDWYERERPPHW